MANTTVTNLPSATALTGSEQLEIVQAGTSVKTTTQAVANLNANGGTVTSISTSAPISGGTITTSGTISLQSQGITNAYLAPMASNTIKGNNSGGLGGPSDLTINQVMTMLGAAPLASPSFTGTPTAPTPATSDNSNQIATTAYVKAQGAGAGTVTSISTGTGLTGGPITTSGTISLANTAVTPGSYGSGTSAPVIAVDQQGRITSASSASITPAGIGAAASSTTISAGSGLTGGGDLTVNRTISLAPVLNNLLLANTSGGSAAPTGTTVSALLDSAVSNTQGSFLYRNASSWTVLLPGTAGYFLTTGGSGSNPYWTNPGAGGTVTSVNASGGTTGLTFSGGPVTTSGTLTLSGTLGIANGGTGITSFGTGVQTALGQNVTGSGSIVLATSPTLTTPNLGTPSAALLTNATGLPLTTGVTGTLAVSNGGTGATTLTGYVKGTGTAALTASSTIPNTDITGLGTMSTQNANSVAITGGTATLSSVTLTSGTISTTPTNATDIANKDYVDSVAAGLNFHQACNYATTTTLPSYVYNNGASGVGATITASANGTLTIDGKTFGAPDVGMRILVKNEAGANQPYNGVYTLTNPGGVLAQYVLTRATDYDSSGSGTNEIDAGDFLLVLAGTANANTSWVQQTPLPITVGTTNIVFTQFAAPVLYSAGTGLNLVGNTFNISNTTVTANSYGSSTAIPTFTVNAQGQLTAASTAAVIAPAGTLTGTTLASNVVSSSLTSVGTIGTGVWNGTTIATGYGGTGLTSFTSGGAVYATSTSTLTTGTLPITAGGTGITAFGTGVQTALGQSVTGSGGIVLATSPTLVTPALGTPSSAVLTNATGLPLTTGVTGTLPVGNGGTGATTFTANGVIYGNTTGALQVTAAGTTGQVLIGNTGAAPSWSSTIPSTAGVTSISFGSTGLTPNSATTGAVTVAGTLAVGNGGTGLTSYTTGDILYASGASTIAKLADVATGSVLVSGGVGVAPSYSATPTVTSLTAPTVLGGTGTGSSLTLQSTSGVGATDSILIKVGNAGAVTALSVATTGIVSLPTTGALVVPVGTTGQQPTGQTGMLRFNSTTTSFEGYNGTAWAAVGGGATGGGTDQIFWQNGQTVNTSYSIPANTNAGSFGPIVIGSSAVVTIPASSNWVIV